MEKGQKNLKIILWILFSTVIMLILRLGYIQLLGHEDLSEVTRTQSMIALKGSDNRAAVLDRNGEALAGNNKEYVYIIKSDMMTSGAEKNLKLLEASEIDSGSLDYKVYTSAIYEKNIGRKLIEDNKAYILQVSARYSENQIAEHFIGYVNKKDTSGASGIELMYDDQLGALDRKVYAVADVAGNILQGRGLEITSGDAVDSAVNESIIVTLDSRIQRAVENIIDNEEHSCAVVILGVNDGGVVAMASTPGFDPENIDKYINRETDELLNKVTQGEYPPGSVFKIIVAAAALESGIEPGKTFSCNGYAQADSMRIKCETGGETGHGDIDMEEAFAHSCNSYFVQLVQQIGADNVIRTATKFGLGNTVLKDFPYECKGTLMSTHQSIGAGAGNLGIGQGETLTTPLQIAAMTNIIAADGVDMGVKVLMSEVREKERIVSSETAKTICQMMEQTVITGTASSLEMTTSEGKAAAAAKTGTAEYNTGRGIRTHAWITGFTPCNDPEYTITVFVEDGGSGSQTAGPIMKKIVKYLQKSGCYSKPTLA